MLQTNRSDRVRALGLAVLAAAAVSWGASPALSAPGPATGQALAVCEALGAPVKQVDYLGFFPTEDAALDVATGIDETIFEVEVRPAAVGGRWVVWARYREIPTQALVEEHRPAMQALGERHGGDLSPGCSVVPAEG